MPEIDLEVLMELPQLAFKVIARDQGVAIAEHFAFCQVSFVSEQPPFLPDHTLDQHLVRDDLLIGRVVPEAAQPSWRPSIASAIKRGG